MVYSLSELFASCCSQFLPEETLPGSQLRHLLFIVEKSHHVSRFQLSREEKGFIKGLRKPKIASFCIFRNDKHGKAAENKLTNTLHIKRDKQTAHTLLRGPARLAPPITKQAKEPPTSVHACKGGVRGWCKHGGKVTAPHPHPHTSQTPHYCPKVSTWGPNEKRQSPFFSPSTFCPPPHITPYNQWLLAVTPTPLALCIHPCIHVYTSQFSAFQIREKCRHTLNTRQLYFSLFLTLPSLPLYSSCWCCFGWDRPPRRKPRCNYARMPM